MYKKVFYYVGSTLGSKNLRYIEDIIKNLMLKYVDKK